MSDRQWLFLDRRGLHVSVEYQTLRVDEGEGRFRRFPPFHLEAVVVHGRIAVTSDVWRLLAAHQVPAVLLPGRGQGPVAWMGAGLGGSLWLRRAQFAAAGDAAARVELARWMVHRKFAGYREALAWAGHPESVFGHRLDGLEEDLASSTDANTVRGVEGVAARLWYEWLAQRIPAEWGFGGRNRRPPRDPVNALLSLGYTLLATQAQGRAEASGLDVSLGFLHEPVPGRPALALDLMEALRPWVDVFVLGLLDRVLGPDDFHSSAADGCRLFKEARGRFYAAWAGWSREVPPAMPGADGQSGRSSGTGPALQREARLLRAWLEARYRGAC